MSAGFPTVTALNLGQVSYPGVGLYEAADFTDVTGVSPAVGTIRVLTQYGIPSPDGDLKFNYQGNTVVIKNCHIDSFAFEDGSGGHVMNIRILDERWKWKDASITGKYNIRLANNWVDPSHEMTPQDLATACFQALGVSLFDVARLPNDSRPEVDWVSANPAEELDRICKDLGCMVVPIRSTGGWSIQVKGEGQNLPEGLPFEDWGRGLDPAEIPDFIKVVTAPIRYQVFLPIGTAVQDFRTPTFQNFSGFSYTLAWVDMKDATYLPNASLPPGYGFTPLSGFKDISRNRKRLTDGTRVSAMELAEQTAFRCFRLNFANEQGATRSANYGTKKNPQYRWGMRIPAIPYPVTAEQIILTDQLVDTYTDFYGQQHQRPAFVQGTFRGDKLENGDNGPNYPPGTRIDKQYLVAGIGMDERASFSLSFDPIDSTRSIITISRVLCFAGVSGDSIDVPGEGVVTLPYAYVPGIGPVAEDVFIPAILQYCCAINVRDPVTWQPYRYEHYLQIGTGGNRDNCRVVVKDDIQPWVKGTYPDPNAPQRPGRGQPFQRPPGSFQTFTGYTTNFDEIAQQCAYYADSVAREYATIQTQTRTYFGIIPQDLNGLVQQITYTIGPDGTSTIMSAGTEHSWITPSAEERRQQVARSSLEGKLAYYRYEMARRDATKGKYNT